MTTPQGDVVSVPVEEEVRVDGNGRPVNRRIPHHRPRRLALADDGIVDEVALERCAAGERLTLTVRERDILVDRLIARGLSDMDIRELAGIRHADVAARRRG